MTDKQLAALIYVWASKIAMYVNGSKEEAPISTMQDLWEEMDAMFEILTGKGLADIRDTDQE